MIKDNIKKITDSINEYKHKYKRNDNIRLMAVSKTYGADFVREAYDSGIKLFGENRVLEAYDKYAELKDISDIDLHIIGHLQRNKAKKAIEISTTVESIDKIDTLVSLQTYASSFDKKVGYLIEVNTSGEPQKSGIQPEYIDKFLEEILKADFSHLILKGLMTVGPLTDNTKDISRSFAVLKKIFDRLVIELKSVEFATLSMGMTGDYQIAIAEGSNLVRIGSGIFGSRSYL